MRGRRHKEIYKAGGRRFKSSYSRRGGGANQPGLLQRCLPWRSKTGASRRFGQQLLSRTRPGDQGSRCLQRCRLPLCRVVDESRGSVVVSLFSWRFQGDVTWRRRRNRITSRKDDGVVDGHARACSLLAGEGGSLCRCGSAQTVKIKQSGTFVFWKILAWTR